MGSNPISSAREPLPTGRGSLRVLDIGTASIESEERVPRYFVRLDVVVETEDQRLIPVELEGRLLDSATRPAGLWVCDATVVAVREQEEAED
jgi:hypothetical protein